MSCLRAHSCRLCTQAWALFKGKFREGIDKPDPPTWKTRLRCALNKSNDFEELVERSQLDISDPYKVYRIVPEGAKKSQSSKLATHSCTHSPLSFSLNSKVVVTFKTKQLSSVEIVLVLLVLVVLRGFWKSSAEGLETLRCC